MRVIADESEGSSMDSQSHNPVDPPSLPYDPVSEEQLAMAAEDLGSALLGVLTCQAAKRCPDLSAVFGRIFFYEVGDDDSFCYALFRLSDGSTLSLAVPTDIYTAFDLYQAVSNAAHWGYPLVAVLAPVEGETWRGHDFFLAALSPVWISAETCLVEVATCGAPFGIAETAWPTRMHLVTPY